MPSTSSANFERRTFFPRPRSGSKMSDQIPAVRPEASNSPPAGQRIPRRKRAAEEEPTMDEVWKAFPQDLHESILKCLPVPDLCRFRTVCRAWNDRTTKPDFAAKSTPPPQAAYVFRTPDSIGIGFGIFKFERGEYDIKDILPESWELFDPSSKKYLALNMMFLYAAVRDRFMRHDECVTIAADRGFVCVLWRSFHTQTSGGPDHVEAIQVANPVTRSLVEIPPLMKISNREHDLAVASMVVTEDHSAFTLYIVLQYDRPNQMLQRAFKFSSDVGAWQGIAQPPATHAPAHQVRAGTTLFTLFWNTEHWLQVQVHRRYTEHEKQPLLFAYDTTSGTWSDTGVRLPRGGAIPQLATALGRLFFVVFGDHGVALYEIDAQAATCTSVANYPKRGAFLRNVGEWSVHGYVVGVGANVIAVGCGDCVVFTTAVGVSFAYSLEMRRWRTWEDNVSIPHHRDILEERCGLFGATMSLTLKPVPGEQVVGDNSAWSSESSA